MTWLYIIAAIFIAVLMYRTLSRVLRQDGGLSAPGDASAAGGDKDAQKQPDTADEEKEARKRRAAEESRQEDEEG